MIVPVRLAEAQESTEPLVLDHADSTELIQTASETEYRLFGDVRFSLGRTILGSDRAVWKRNAGAVELDGNVTVHQPGLWFASQKVTYAREGRLVHAEGDVHLEDTSEGFMLSAPRARFDRETDVAVAGDRPVVHWDFLLDSAARTIVHADTITFFRRERRGVGEGSVQVYKGDWYAEGERGEIWPDSGRAILTGHPMARGIGGTIRGDSLELVFAGRSVSRVRAIGNASGTYRDTTANAGTSLLRGREADFFLANDSLRAIRVVGEAFTDQQPDDTTSGANHASGDSLWLNFASGRLEKVTISGGAQGQYVSPRRGSGADTVDYRAARIDFYPDSNRVDLETDGRLNYGQIVLDAGRISYWTDRRNLLARPLEIRDSAGNPLGRPRLSDGQQVVTGSQLTYNIDSRRGRIRGSATEFEGAYYSGRDFRKYSDSIFFVNKGTYTTCNLPEPHFRFESNDMEIIRNDKVIARPVVMKIGELPMFALPYYIFPIRRGRHSGFLPLRVGNFVRGERFIGNVGYYWAASDYWDTEGSFDYNEATGLLFHGNVNYAWRYHFTGAVSGTYSRASRVDALGVTKRTSWSMVGSHQQVISPSASLNARADFLSDKSYYQRYSFDPSDRRRRDLRSYVNFNKRWKNASVTGVGQVAKSLDSDARTITFPQVNFELFRRALIARDTSGEARWYHNFYANYSSQLVHSESRTPVAGDTTGRVDKRQQLTIDHRSSLSWSHRLFGQINIAPNASLTETWYYVFSTKVARDFGVPVENPARRLAGSVGVSARTNFYGFMKPKLWGLSSIRHTLTPSIGYSYTPSVTRHEVFRDFTRVGGGGRTKSQVMSLSISNSLDAKLHSGEKEKKVSLGTISMSTGYNFEADERRWSNLSGSARTSLAGRMDLSANATWDLYDPKTLNLQWTNPRLLNFDISAAMSLRGGISALTSVTALGEDARGRDTASGSTRIPFNASFSYRYSESKGQARTFKDHWLGWRFDFNPATQWTVRYQQTYNFERNLVTDQTFEFTRDLHCWQALFVWRPGGSGQGYYFRVGVKAIPDIKIERSESGLLGSLWRR